MYSKNPFDVTTTREPKGKLNSNYKVYTVQDYSQRDYYIIKATVTGYPGCVLGAAYESKYQGEGMYVNIGTSTTSVTVDDYGPSRDIASGSSSYGVSLDGSFDGEDFTVQFGLNYTKLFNTTDTTVSTTGTSTSPVPGMKQENHHLNLQSEKSKHRTLNIQYTIYVLTSQYTRANVYK